MKFISCPKCNCQYHPAEIFLPKVLLGTPVAIEKTDNGDIVYTSDKGDNTEFYTCDKCNTQFKVIANIDFETELVSNIDMSDAYVSEI